MPNAHAVSVLHFPRPPAVNLFRLNPAGVVTSWVITQEPTESTARTEDDQMPPHNGSFAIGVDQRASDFEQVLWVLRSSTGRILFCTLCPVGPAFEVRVGLRKEPGLRTELVATKRAGTSLARTLKMIALSRGLLKPKTNCRTVINEHLISDWGLQ